MLRINKLQLAVLTGVFATLAVSGVAPAERQDDALKKMLTYLDFYIQRECSLPSDKMIRNTFDTLHADRNSLPAQLLLARNKLWHGDLENLKEADEMFARIISFGDSHSQLSREQQTVVSCASLDRAFTLLKMNQPKDAYKIILEILARDRERLPAIRPYALYVDLTCAQFALAEMGRREDFDRVEELRKQAEKESGQETASKDLQDRFARFEPPL